MYNKFLNKVAGVPTIWKEGLQYTPIAQVFTSSYLSILQVCCGIFQTKRNCNNLRRVLVDLYIRKCICIDADLVMLQITEVLLENKCC